MISGTTSKSHLGEHLHNHPLRTGVPTAIASLSIAITWWSHFENAPRKTQLKKLQIAPRVTHAFPEEGQQVSLRPASSDGARTTFLVDKRPLARRCLPYVPSKILDSELQRGGNSDAVKAREASVAEERRNQQRVWDLQKSLLWRGDRHSGKRDLPGLRYPYQPAHRMEEHHEQRSHSSHPRPRSEENEETGSLIPTLALDSPR